MISFLFSILLIDLNLQFRKNGKVLIKRIVKASLNFKVKKKSKFKAVPIKLYFRSSI